MKKLLSIVWALALALSLSVTAFAADTQITDQSPDKTGKTSVTYGVTAAYTVTIPASVSIGGADNSNTVIVSAENVKVAYGEQVVVRLTGINESEENENGDSEFQVKTKEGAALKYVVKKGESEVTTAADNNIVLAVNPNSTTDQEVASGSQSLTFALADNQVVQYAGEYYGTVTFTVSVEEVPGNDTTGSDTTGSDTTGSDTTGSSITTP